MVKGNGKKEKQVKSQAMKVITSTIRRMVKAYSIGPVGITTKEALKMMKDMALAS